uniref:Uncharacterized protein n=1 Tax=Romanomermis culicivorax TaxID=13658 RepID=A0A915JFD7_ROMCU
MDKQGDKTARHCQRNVKSTTKVAAISIAFIDGSIVGGKLTQKVSASVYKALNMPSVYLLPETVDHSNGERPIFSHIGQSEGVRFLVGVIDRLTHCIENNIPIVCLYARKNFQRFDLLLNDGPIQSVQRRQKGVDVAAGHHREADAGHRAGRH